MSDHDDDDAGWELLVPFVATVSHGGPFDDLAFTAGFSTGVLWMRLGVAKPFEMIPFTTTIQRHLLGQVDLMAMHYDLAMTELEQDIDEATRAEWAVVSFDWPTTTIDGDGDRD